MELLGNVIVVSCSGLNEFFVDEVKFFLEFMWEISYVCICVEFMFGEEIGSLRNMEVSLDDEFEYEKFVVVIWI